MRPRCSYALLLGLALTSCGGDSSEDDPPIARAYDQVLHWSDLRQFIPIGTAAEDSAAMAEAYINAWMHQQVELHHAELNLAPDRKGFENELRDYRNSLLMHAYEEELVRQRLDTNINAEELEAYYHEHAGDFDLADDIMRARWFKVPVDDRRALKRLENRFMSGKADDMREVEIALVQRGITIIDRSGQWTTLAELRNEVPVEALPGVGPEGRRIVIQALEAAWFLDILELRPRHAPSPIELVRQDIRTILLNRRKLDLIEKMREDLLNDAIASKSVVRY
ncbi:MAG: hypothetical protein IPM46_04775 [Flavobacteriales bacterium]|nr:hypothetical protein [Flavobacteriales bacterium]